VPTTTQPSDRSSQQRARRRAQSPRPATNPAPGTARPTEAATRTAPSPSRALPAPAPSRALPAPSPSRALPAPSPSRALRPTEAAPRSAPAPSGAGPAPSRPRDDARGRRAPSAEPTATGFAALGVPAALVQALAATGITEPFPIQQVSLPDALAGRDLLGRGRTGSGKTLAFAIPLVARLVGSGGGRRPRQPRGLVLAPTRELASQIAQAVRPLADAAGLTVTTVFGGVGQAAQVAALAAGVDILVACPGRLEDLKGQGLVHLDAVEISILDEADHMADLGFLPGVRRLLDATPPRGQRLLFSATLDNGVDVLVRRYLTDPVTHSVDSASSPVVAMTHHLLEVASPGEKTDVVRRLASGSARRVLFTRTKHRARSLARQLTASGIPAVDLHGNLSQNARERNLAAFSAGEVKVLVATDIAARGIHVDDVGLVVHVDPPIEHKAYLHRSGRTARAGSGGDVITVVLPEERAEVRQMTRAAQVTPKPVDPASSILDRLVGDVAPAVDPADAPAAAARAPGAVAPRAAGRPQGQRAGQRQGQQRAVGAQGQQLGAGGQRQPRAAGGQSRQAPTGGQGRSAAGQGARPPRQRASTPARGR
jgi:superfamily II DNA/RNA helicase